MCEDRSKTIRREEKREKGKAKGKAKGKSKIRGRTGEKERG